MRHRSVTPRAEYTEHRESCPTTRVAAACAAHRIKGYPGGYLRATPT
jgi:hypothetical protein